MFIHNTLKAEQYSPKTPTLAEINALRGVMNENRGIRRPRVLKDGKIVFNAGGSLVNCSIHDLSVGGAKVRLIASTTLPDYFELLCVTNEFFYPARLAWRRGEYVGLTFVGPPRRKLRLKKPDNRACSIKVRAVARNHQLAYPASPRV